MYVDDIKLAGKKQNMDPMWKVLLKEGFDVGERTSFLDHVHSKRLRNEQRKGGQLQRNVCFQDLCRSNRKATLFRETWRRHLFMVMQKNVWSDIASWRTKQPSNCTKLQLHASMTTTLKNKNSNPCENHPCLDDHQIKKEELENKGELPEVCSQFFWNACIWHALDDPTIHGQWTNLHDHSQTGPKLVTNDYLCFDLLHSSHKWIQTILSCGKHGTTMQAGTVSGLWFCRRSWGLKIYIRWNIVHFRKPQVCSNQLDV